MTLTLRLRPEIEAEIEAQARAKGMPVEAYSQEIIERVVKPREYDLDALFAKPREEQDRLLTAAAEDAGELYRAELARPVNERELTAFTALDGENFLDEPA